jgi:hypothetical protein
MTFRQYVASQSGKPSSEILVLANSIQKTVHPGVYISALTLASKWGADRAGEILAALKGVVASGQLNPQQKETIGLILSWLTDPSSPGIDAGNPRTRMKLPEFAALGVITEAEVIEIYSWAETASTIAKDTLGRDATLEDVDTAIWQNENEQAAADLLHKANLRFQKVNARAAEYVGAVENGVVITPPTWDELKALFTNEPASDPVAVDAVPADTATTSE